MFRLLKTSYNSINSIKIPLFPLLKFSFIFSFISVQLTFWKYYFTGEYDPYYFALAIVYFFTIITIFFNYKFEMYDKKVLFLILYLTTVPVLLTNFNIRVIQKGLQAVVVPFVLYFFLKITLNSYRNIYRFLRLIVFAGVITVLYSSFEHINRFKNIWPTLFEIQINFLEKYRHGFGYLEDQIYQEQSLIRPIGIFFDLHSQGFIMLTTLMIILCLGDRIFKKRYLSRFLLGFMIYGIILSTVKTYILILIGLSFVYFLLKWKYVSLKRNSKRKQAPLIIIIVLFIFMYFFYSIFGNTFVSLFGFSSEGYGTYNIIKEHLWLLITEEISTLFASNPIRLLLGYGYSYSEELVIGGEVHFLGEHLTMLGIVGTILYWGLFVRVLRECLRYIKRMSNNQEEDMGIFVFGIMICITLMATLLHYSPLGICSNFIAALILFIGNLAFRNNRRFKSSEYKFRKV